MSENPSAATPSTTAFPIKSVHSTIFPTSLKYRQLNSVPVKTMRQKERQDSSGKTQKEAAAKALQEYYHNEELKALRQRAMISAAGDSEANEDNTHRNTSSKQDKPKQMSIVWFSCSNIATCVAITAFATSLVCTLFIVGIIILWLRCGQSRKNKLEKKFSADEWWRQPAATPLLLLPTLNDDDDDQHHHHAKSEDILRLKKYLKRYMSINQTTQQKAAEMPDIPEEREPESTQTQELTSKTASLKDVPSTASYQQSIGEPKSISSHISANSSPIDKTNKTSSRG